MLDSKEKILIKQAEFYNSYNKINNNPRYRKAWKYILNKKNTGTKKVLDIGCANGDFSVGLLKFGFHCFGLEGTSEAILVARSRGVEVVDGSFLDKFPFESGFFDIIFAGEVIEHTTDDNDFLFEVNRVLKPGGLLILTTPNLVSLGNRLLMLLGLMPRFSYTEFHYRIYNQKLIKKKVAGAGFKILNVKSSYILISTFFNKMIGCIGEFLGDLFPSLGEHFIIFAEKIKE